MAWRPHRRFSLLCSDFTIHSTVSTVKWCNRYISHGNSLLISLCGDIIIKQRATCDGIIPHTQHRSRTGFFCLYGFTMPDTHNIYSMRHSDAHEAVRTATSARTRRQFTDSDGPQAKSLARIAGPQTRHAQDRWTRGHIAAIAVTRIVLHICAPSRHLMEALKHAVQGARSG